MQQTIFDCHCHSCYSPDGNTRIDELAFCAFENGIAGICVTDHCDLNTPAPPEGYAARFQKSHSEILQLRKKWNSKVNILSGIEIGQVLNFEEEARAVIAAVDFDFVLLSWHCAFAKTDLFLLDYSRFSEIELEKLCRSYFERVSLSVQHWDDFDAFAHLTLPSRYLKLRCGIDIDLRRYSDELEVILKTLISKGKGLEINTSGLGSGHGTTMPDPWLIKYFRELGGQIITLGSDAHSGKDIGSFLHSGASIAYNAGFRYAAYYKERKPIFYPI